MTRQSLGLAGHFASADVTEIAVDKVDHFLEPRADFRRESKIVDELQRFSEELLEMMTAFFRVGRLWTKYALRHDDTPRAWTGEAPPTSDAAPPTR